MIILNAALSRPPATGIVLTDPADAISPPTMSRIVPHRASEKCHDIVRLKRAESCEDGDRTQARWLKRRKKAQGKETWMTYKLQHPPAVQSPRNHADTDTNTNTDLAVIGRDPAAMLLRDF